MGVPVLKEFGDSRQGQRLDLAVGVIIGAAFGAIVSSLVDDVFMPAVESSILGHVDFSNCSSS